MKGERRKKKEERRKEKGERRNPPPPLRSSTLSQGDKVSGKEKAERRLAKLDEY